ncbi:ArsR/SmtB family transcription factor [Paractinoplanes toevensis]|uniref:Transcriptional regulator, ArsR family protein n=1 Tax=Paractinoplanes toevensis TaxID=571911 RepID=A0A919T7L8_9ACTN|nr:metalloregulator ArsR/SmtB family transcription factor [Actinoplanes toevensis]GIM90495.1 putative transcriptional regulator, ArsR family protein [Actinoplanes toevensis]
MSDAVFRALADPSRRRLLDSLRKNDGQTLGQLCGQLAMARQSVTQHLAVLQEANLISTVRNGREKLHYLNPVPIHDMQQRWLAPFDQPRLNALAAIKQNAEEPDMKPSFVYVTYIESTPERVWHALTDADLTADFWGHSNISDWQPGSRWEHRRVDGSEIVDCVGRVIESTPPSRLAITFEDPNAQPDDDPSVVTFTVEPYHDIVRLTVTHENLAGDDELHAISAGWPAVMANLKSLLETGHVLPQAPWEMHADLRDAQMARHDA